jgi:hypothetical protein
MYILTKRTVFDEIGRVQHNIHGWVHSVNEARVWFRSGRQTDVVEIPDSGTDGPGAPWLPIHYAQISENRFESWREMQAKHEKQLRSVR